MGLSEITTFVPMKKIQVKIRGKFRINLDACPWFVARTGGTGSKSSKGCSKPNIEHLFLKFSKKDRRYLRKTNKSEYFPHLFGLNQDGESSSMAGPFLARPKKYLIPNRCLKGPKSNLIRISVKIITKTADPIFVFCVNPTLSQL